MRHQPLFSTIICLVISAWSLLSSCGGETFPNLSYSPSDDNVISPTNSEYVNVGKTPLKIRASHQEFFTILPQSRRTTRGTGAFDPPATDTEKYNNAIFYVYAFRVGTGTNGEGGQHSLTSAPDLSLSAYSPSHEGANDKDNSSCLLDGNNYLTGAPYHFNENEEGTFISTMADTLYYSGKYTNVGYNFFAYHIDDWQPTESNTHRNKDAITYDIEIDGARDILMGSASPLTDSLINADYNWLNKMPLIRDSILSMHGGYSTTSGMAAVQPRIKLMHKLTRFQFEAFPGDSAANQMVIDSISIIAPYKAKMKVAGRKADSYGITFDTSSKKELFLSEASTGTTPVCGRLKKGGYSVPSWTDDMKSMALVDRPSVTLATANGKTGSLLVPPATSYDAYIYYTYRDEHGHISKPAGVANPAHCKIALTDKNGNVIDTFKPGTVYTVRMGIYGPRLIRIGASITGGNVAGWIRSDGKIDSSTEDWEEEK